VNQALIGVRAADAPVSCASGSQLSPHDAYNNFLAAYGAALPRWRPQDARPALATRWLMSGWFDPASAEPAAPDFLTQVKNR